MSTTMATALCSARASFIGKTPSFKVFTNNIRSVYESGGNSKILIYHDIVAHGFAASIKPFLHIQSVSGECHICNCSF